LIHFYKSSTMSTPSQLQETFFSLKTLTLTRRGAEFQPRQDALDHLTDPDNQQQQQPQLQLQDHQLQQQQQIQSNKGIPEAWLKLLQQHWQKLLLLGLVALNIMVVGVLYSSTSAKVESNLEQISQLQSTQVHSTQYSLSLKSDSQDTNNVDASNLKHILLNLASQQSELNSLRETVKENSLKMRKIEENKKTSSFGQADMFETILAEADITFCAGENNKLIAPLKSVYKVEFSAKVHGNTYINRKMFEIQKNTRVLLNGGTMRIKYNGKSDNSVECSTKETTSVPKSCFLMQQALLVQMDERDELKVVSMLNTAAGQIYDLSFCMKTTQNMKVPGGQESLIITH